MMIKKTIGILLLLMTVVTVSGAPRTAGRMRTAAVEVLTASNGKRHAPGHQKSLALLASTDDYAVFGYHDGGFAIISADDALPEVLGYSDKIFNANQGNPNFRWWLNAVTEISQQVRSGRAQAPAVVYPDTTLYKAQVPSLMTSEWGQDTPFWNFCPVNGDTCVTGCVATAMAQIIYYNRWPEQGTGSHTMTSHGQQLTANFGETTYEYDKMRDLYYRESYTQEEGEAVALLMSHCGIAVDMSYSPDGSGAYSRDAEKALRDYFNYPDAQYLLRSSYSEKQWMNIIFDELSHGRVLYYGGDDPDPVDGGGHAFVLDGYDERGLVSVNWGWNGTENGYYTISLLNPRTYAFTAHQEMIRGLQGNPISLVPFVVDVQKAGSVATMIPDSLLYRISALKVRGEINNTDLGVIRKMAGRNTDGSVSKGHLAILDLSEARIVGGGNAYLRQGGMSYTCHDDELGAKVFYGCRQLRMLKLPPTIKSIGVGAFGFCTKLDSIVGLRDSKECDYILEESSLYNRSDTTCLLAVLPSVTGSYSVKPGITTIGDYAFSSCQYLKQLTIPSSVRRIGREGLCCSWKLQQIKLMSPDPIEVGVDGLFGIRKSMAKLLVPAGSKEKYKRHAEWGAFCQEGPDGFDNIVEFGSAITARNAGKDYGDPVPKLGYSISGDIPEGTPEVWCDVDEYSPAGTYPIHVAPGTITDEVVEYIDGVFTIWKSRLNVSVGECTRLEGEENPVFTLSYDGFKLGETEDVLRVRPVATCEATPASPAGEYPILISGGEADNYEFRYVKGILKVEPDPTGIRHITADQSPMDVYTLDGRKISNQITSPNGIPAGTYIIKGKKLIVK